MIGYAIGGYRNGAVVGFFSLAGFVGGAALAMWGLPKLLTPSLSTAGQTRHMLLLVVGVLVAAVLGQAVGSTIGSRLRSRVTSGGVRRVDSVVGALASVVAIAVLVSLIAGAVRGGPSPSLSRAVGQSRIVATIDKVMPAQAGQVFAGFRSLLDAEGFPKVFEGLGPEFIRPV